MSLRALVDGWNDFWFTPQRTTPIALYRILYGLLLLAYGAFLAPDLLVWLGERGVLSLETSTRLYGAWHLDLLTWLPRGDGSVIGLLIVFMVASLTLTLGLCTRVSACVVFLCLVSIHHRNVMILHSGDTFLRVSAFFLMFSEAGSAMSVDRLVRVLRGRERAVAPRKPPWAQRLIQVQLALVYFATVLWKAQGPMWADGTAIYYSSRVEEFWRYPVPYVFEHLWTIKLSTWGTLIVEFALATLVWFIELRYVVLAAGVLLHLGIDYSMDIPLFTSVMLAAYVTFIEPHHLRGAMDWVRTQVVRRCAGPARAFYDGHCRLCVRSASAIRMLDVLNRVRLVDFRVAGARSHWPEVRREEAEQQMLLRTDGGTWLKGFRAWGWMAWRLPALWVVAPALHLPGVPILGAWVYGWVARHRQLVFGKNCETGSCERHGGT